MSTIANLLIKQCSKCKKILPIEQFSKDKGQSSGYACSCRDCRHKTYLENIDTRKEYILKNNEEILEKQRERYRNNREKEINRVSNYRRKNNIRVLEYNMENGIMLVVK